MCFPRKLKLSGSRWAAALLAAAGAALLLAAAPAAAKKPQTLYWGAQIGDQMTGEQAPWDMRPVHRFERIAGKGLSLVEFAAPFAECEPVCVFGKFPTTPLNNVRDYGAIPIFSWNSTVSPPDQDQSAFRLSDLIEGRYDAFVRGFAAEAAAWGHPFFLRFDWEMNGFWFPWSEGVNGNRPGEYVQAWRHVHDLFAAAGASNATWVWCPNVDIFGGLAKLGPLYPGGRYVDWTCLDGFNWGKRRGSPGWLGFGRIFGDTYRRIVKHIAPGKPMLLAETASSDRGGNKPAWIRDMLHTVRTKFLRVRGVVWYDVDDRGTNWPIETSKKASAAFRHGVRGRAYRPNEFGGIATAPIKPPPRP
ncbi:MAG TPA: glycosyl hydrolase [Solirubrobacterales bacterium]|jgi:hypothetical protein|nr:glycosyl hydrolase [Solirubrobacterales bacterium]